MKKNQKKSTPLGISNIPLIGFNGLHKLFDYSLIEAFKGKKHIKK